MNQHAKIGISVEICCGLRVGKFESGEFESLKVESLKV
jgi:hypothetical protein